MHPQKNVLILFAFFLMNAMMAQNSITVIYDEDTDIPTSYPDYDPSCTGPGVTLSVTLPTLPGSYEIVGIDIKYDFTAQNFGFMADQRSQVYCQNTSILESQVYVGSGVEGTHEYERLDVNIANGDYAPGTELVFEMHAWRVYNAVNSDCSIEENFIADEAWEITIYYNLCPLGDVEIIGQTEMNVFVTNYSSCPNLPADLEIKSDGIDQINDVSGLSFVETIEGWLIVRENDQLSTFSMGNLTSVNGGIVIGHIHSPFRNLALQSTSFPLLSNISGPIRHINNPVLASANFPALLTVENIEFGTVDGDYGNAELQTIDLPVLQSANSIYINHSPLLSLFSLPNATTVAGLRLVNNDVLTSCQFPLLNSITTLEIMNCESSNLSIPSLNTLNSLQIINTSLTELQIPLISDFSVNVRYNDLLNTIEFADLNNSSSFRIWGNDVLQSVDVPLLTTCGFLDIDNNDDLTSLELDLLQSASGITVSDNELLNNIDFPALQSLQFSLIIGSQVPFPETSNSQLSSINIPQLTNIPNDFEFIGNSSYNNDLLPNLISIGGRLLFDGNHAFDANLLGSLQTVGDDIVIGNVDDNRGNNALSNIELPSLNSLSGSFNILGNDALTNISLPLLTDFGTDFQLINNDAIQTISGLETVNEVEMHIQIVDNDGLESLTGLEHLIAITGNLTISDNDLLQDISQIQDLILISNVFQVSGNSLLSDCCVIEFLSENNVYSSVILNSNAPGCEDLNDIQYSCALEDQDEDGIKSANDNCPEIYNPKQEDSDSDEIGNACDNCPLISNNDQADENNNFIGNLCETAEPGKAGVNTTSPKAGLEISASELYLSDISRGLIMTNANGECYRLLVDLEGELRVKAITCPD